MNRRRLFEMLSAIPFLRWLKPEPCIEHRQFGVAKSIERRLSMMSPERRAAELMAMARIGDALVASLKQDAVDAEGKGDYLDGLASFFKKP